MKIFSLYKDFFNFIDRIPSCSNKWETYLSHYCSVHKDFFDAYFAMFPLLDSENLQQRVEATKESDYSWLRHLVTVCKPEEIVAETYERCVELIAPQEEPDIYLFVGFFSPDGFVMNIGEKPVMCFGLERFKDFLLLRILFAHEYIHYLLRLNAGEVSEAKRFKWLLISEGLATYFSSLVFPEYDLVDHLLLSRDVLNWCQVNEALIKHAYFAESHSFEELVELYKKGNIDLGIPPRVGKFLAFLSVKSVVERRYNNRLELLISDREAALSLDL
jgi:hypothetical protein